MASSGGGKIKSKRPRGAKKPYQRPKSIFSQVTETVSGLVVPSWLKNMWSGPAEPEPEEEPHEPTSPEFDPDVPSTSYGTGYPPSQRQHLQGRGEETPNTGSFSIIRQSERHEPKGSRNQTSQDTPLPFSAYTRPIQTSTPVENEFVPSHRDVKISERDDDTDSSVSTSGCSSLLPHVDRADHKEKLAQSNLDQLSERSQSSHNTPSRMSLWSDTNTFNTSQSYRGARQSESKPQPAAKRPRFNASYFGTPRQITTPVTGEKHKSAFYPGRTTFGGSSFYRSPARKQHNPSPYQVHLPVRRHIRPKPAAHSTMDPDFGVTSNTAMKILNTLDRMSTPLSDAKRIPLTPTPSPFAFNRQRSFLPEKKTGPPVSGMQVGGQARVMSNVQPPPPASSASISTDLTDKDSCTSQNLTTSNKESVTRIPNPSVTFSRTETSKSTFSQVKAVPGSPPKSGGKMKSKSRNSLHYSASREEDEIVEVPDLPEVALPIPSNAMPSFNFGGLKSNSSVTKIPAPVSTVNGSSPTLHLDKPVVENKVKALPSVTSTPDWTVSSLTKDKAIPESINTSPVNKPLMTSTPFPGTKPAAQFQFSSSIGKSEGSEFKFSVPAVKSSSSDAALPAASAGEFTFSAPEVKESSKKISSGFSFTKPTHVKEDTTKDETDDEPSSGGIKVAATLKSGSCLQALGLTSSQAKSSTASVTSVTTTGSLSLMDKFKPAPGSWECEICCVTNDKDKLKCVACQSEKPKGTVPYNTLQSSTGFSLADKFKPEAGSWECSTCLVRNKADKTKCEACQTSKPSSSGASDSVTATSTDNEVLMFGDKFKPAEGSWECDTCMVQNTSTSSNCVACQTKKPGAPPPSSVGVGFGFGDKFKPPSGSWTCDTCLVQNQAVDSKCLACQTSKPSSSQISSNSGGFSKPESVLNTNKSSQILFGSKTVSDESKLKSESSNKPSLSDLFKVEAGTWDCDTCMVQNKPSSTRCAACETPKPGSQPTLGAPPASSFKFGSSVTSSESATSSSSGGFKFDGTIPSLSSGTTSSFGGFQFNSGAKSETTKGSSGGMAIPTSLQGFSFSFPKKSTLDSSSTSQASTVAVSSSVGFSLGFSQDSNPSGGISLELPKGSQTSTEGSKVSDNVKPLSTGFTFGDKTEKSSSKKTQSFTFGASSTSSTLQTTGTGTPDLAVGSTEATDKGVVSTSHKPLGFQFGSNSNVTLSSSQVARNASPFQSSAPTSTDSKPTVGTLGVNPLLTTSTGSASAANQSSTSSFLATTIASKKSEPSANATTFQFGSNLNSASSSSSQSAVQPGERKEAEPSSTSTDNEGFKPTFNFVGANPAAPSINFGSTATKEKQSVPLFGATSKANLGNQQQNASPFQFGAASTSSNPTTVNKSLFTFGSSSQQSQAPSSNTSGFQFGAVSSSSQNSQPADKPFTFGAPPTSMQSSVGSFAASKTVTGFDAAGTASNTSEVPSFGGFGTNAVASNTSGSIFGNAQPQQNTAPAFGQGGTLQNSFGTSANSVPTFGSSNPSPAFGSSTSGFGSSNPGNTNNSGFQSESKSLGFQFGQSNNNNQSGVFQFSGASNPQPTNNSQPGFNFNANQPPSFNFGVAPASAQSTFQFGASQPNSTNPFNATAAPGGRKIKRAVRRTGKKT